MKKEKLKPHICQVRGLTYKPHQIIAEPKENYIPILKANNITKDGLDISNLIYIHKDLVKETQIIRKGDIIIAASSGSVKIIGKNTYFDLEGNFTFGAFCKVARPKHSIFPEYLKHFFKTAYYKRTIISQVQGANINNLKTRDLDDLIISLPEDYNDQKRIAQVLSNCESSIHKRKESIALLDELLKSTFLEMFGDPVKNDKKLKFVSLAKYGDFKNGLNYSKNEVGLKVRYLGVGDFKKHNRISDMHLLKEISLSKKPSDDYFLKDGDLVFVRSNGNKELVGRCVVVNPEKENVTFSGFCIRFRPTSELLNTLYLSHLFTIETFKKKMLQSGRGANIQNINQKLLGELKIPLPSLQSQNKFVEVVEKVETLKLQYQTHLKELENLYGSISQKAFKGELDLSKVVLHEDLTISNQNTKPIKNITSKLKEVHGNKLGPKVNLIDEPIVNESNKIPPLYFKITLIEYFKYNQGTYQDFITDYISRFENRNRNLDHEQLKIEIFKLLDVNQPKLIQYFDELDNTVKLKLTDEAN